MRRCIACRTSRPQDELIRFTFDGEVLAADRGRPSDGRGIYLCRNRECFEAAIKRRAFNRACRRNIDTKEIAKVIDDIIVDG